MQERVSQATNQPSKEDIISQAKTYAQTAVTGVDIPFGSLVLLMIKISRASVPAASIISLPGLVLGILFSFAFAGVGMGLWY